LDFHGHSRLHGTFAYGCPNDDDPELRDHEKTMPRVLAFLSDAFSWSHCVFSFPKDRKAAGRIVTRLESNVVNSFTIESSFGGICAGPRAGCLYDEILWKELGLKCGVAVYHMLKGQNLPLVSYVDRELAFLAPRPRPLGETEEREQVPVRFADDGAAEAAGKPRPKPLQNMFYTKKPAAFLRVDPGGIQTLSHGVQCPVWNQMQFPIG
jgi:hypothetical protein